MSILDLQNKSFEAMSIYINFDASDFTINHKKVLNLKREDIIWLNALSKVDNVFNSYPSAEIQIIKIYLKCLRAINRRLKDENSSIGKKTKILKNLAKHSRFDYPANTRIYRKGYVENDIQQHIYRHVYARAESLVREKWELRIKINPEYFSPINEIQTAFYQHLGALIAEEIVKLSSFIDEADDDTEMMLNQLDNLRWKEQLKRLSKQYPREQDQDLFFKSINRLVYLNKRNNNKHLLLYDATKILASRSKYEALRLYLHYLYENPNKLIVKPLSTSMKKILSLDPVQLEAFEMITANFSGDATLDLTLDKLKKLFSHI